MAIAILCTIFVSYVLGFLTCALVSASNDEEYENLEYLKGENEDEQRM